MGIQEQQQQKQILSRYDHLPWIGHMQQGQLTEIPVGKPRISRWSDTCDTRTGNAYQQLGSV